MGSSLGGSELRNRVRREESEAFRAARSGALNSVAAIAAVVFLLGFGADLLSRWLPRLDHKIASTLPVFPAAIFVISGLMYSIDTATHTRRWLKTRAIRRRVDRKPELAPLLVPPLAAHLATLKQVAGHRRATLRKLLLAAIPAALLVATLIFGVTFIEKDGSRRSSPESVPWAVAVFAVLTVVLLVPVVKRLRRWYAASTVQRWSENPALAARLSPLGPDPDAARATQIPPLTVRFVRPPPSRRAAAPVTPHSNVHGKPPIRIAYLRLFENQQRVRGFLHGAWREFGYVHLLRSAASVGPEELRAVRRANSVASLFVNSPRLFRQAVDGQPVEPLPPGSRRLTAVTDLPVKVHDRYGSYPVRSVLCHGSFWQSAVDLLLTRVDLVVLDMSGYRPANAGTRFELQRVIDRFPAARTVLLCDPASDEVFLEAQIRHHWARMAHGSPNSGSGSRQLVVAATDASAVFYLQVADNRRSATRWLAAYALDRTDA